MHVAALRWTDKNGCFQRNDKRKEKPQSRWAWFRANSNLYGFYVNNHIVYIVETYNDLRSWSVQSYGSFWEEFFTFSGIKFSQPHEEVSQCVQCNIHHTVACYKSHDCIASDQQIVMSWILLYSGSSILYTFLLYEVTLCCLHTYTHTVGCWSV